MSFVAQIDQWDESTHRLQLQGRLDSPACPDFEGVFMPLVGRPGARVVLDCQGLDYVASAGLRVVLMGAKRAAQGGRLLLCNVQDNVREVLEISGFLKILTVCADLDAAREALGSSGG